MSQYNDEQRKRINLIKSVFDNPKGHELLTELSDEFIFNKKIHVDSVNETFFNLGVESLIIEFINTVNEVMPNE